ncbi:MAG: 5-dehydro-2-deoxygluconokinase [Rhodospirillaceae bacterium]|nr:5-dehydro-2-deoxygluconokinase [Rhodospirillaceae bacterium]
MPQPTLDVLTVGRASVDLYGQQIGGRLEDMASFAKSVGGCPANIAIGCARLGLRAALLTRVGDEAMGRFIREQLAREGVDTRGVITDPERLTALVVLGVRDDKRFPLIFYRENCADMALCEADVDPALVESARAVVVTGTHMSTDRVRAASRRVIDLARAAGRKVAFDIDYRPNLWGLAGHDAGEARYIAAAAVTRRLQDILPLADLVVGTEEELHIAGGTTDTKAALKAIRALTPAVVVLKRGAAGCVVFPGPIPDRLDDGIVGRGFPVEIYNVLGAGDAFMAGLLRGWLGGEDWATAAAYANACGAIAVSRLLCSPEYPSWPELQHFIAHGPATPAVRRDAALSHIHWATATRRRGADRLFAFAIDHRAGLAALADRLGAPQARIGAFKRLALQAVRRVAGGRDGFGMLLDDRYGREALMEAAEEPLWIGRPIEESASRPLAFEPGPDPAAHIVEWPLAHTVKCLVFYHPEDSAELKAQQEARLLTLADACRRLQRELMVEVIAGKHGPLGPDTVARVLERFYDLGLRPDWWKLEPQASAAAWERITGTVAARDPLCRGIVLLGLEAPEEALGQAFAAVARFPLVKGFAVGRTLWMPAAQAWLAGSMSDAAAVEDMATRYERLVALWHAARAQAAA